MVTETDEFLAEAAVKRAASRSLWRDGTRLATESVAGTASCGVREHTRSQGGARQRTPAKPRKTAKGPARGPVPSEVDAAGSYVS